jgi:hypothetical protein
MSNKSGSSGSDRAPPKTPDPILLDSFLEQLETFHSTPSLLSRLECIDRREGHPEQSRGEGGGDGFDQDGPGEGGEKSKDSGVGGRVPESGDGCLDPITASKSDQFMIHFPTRTQRSDSQSSSQPGIKPINTPFPPEFPKRVQESPSVPVLVIHSSPDPHEEHDLKNHRQSSSDSSSKSTLESSLDVEIVLERDTRAGDGDTVRQSEGSEEIDKVGGEVDGG